MSVFAGSFLDIGAEPLGGIDPEWGASVSSIANRVL